MDSVDILDEREYKIIDALSQKKLSTQREISHHTGISLGLTNIIIKRLVKKGFLKIKKINKRRIFYYLTPKALLQRSIRTYNYIEKTVKDVIEIKKRIQSAVVQKINSDYKKIFITGKNEIAEIAKWALLELKLDGINIEIEKKKKVLPDDIVLVINCEKESIKKQNYLNIFELL